MSSELLKTQAYWEKIHMMFNIHHLLCVHSMLCNIFMWYLYVVTTIHSECSEVDAHFTDLEFKVQDG